MRPGLDDPGVKRWQPIAAGVIDGAIIASFVISDGWFERRIGALGDVVARRLT